MGVSSLLGFLGSVAFPLLRAKLGTPFTALIGSLTIYIYANLCQHFTHFTQECPSWLFAMQSVQSRSFSLPHSSWQRQRARRPTWARCDKKRKTILIGMVLTQVYMFVGGLTAARFGLHLYDLCVIQLFQEGVRALANVDILRNISAGGRGEKRGLLRGGDFALLRNGSHQVCPGLLSSLFLFPLHKHHIV